ncbi:MAG TPA: DUF393 domain-containing protein [Actinomycetota bacterium]
MTEAAVMLYDDTCGFCRRAMQIVRAWDGAGRIRAVALGTPESATLLAGMSESERMDSWHLAVGGRVYSAGAAVGPLMRLLPFGSPVGALADAFPDATERAYRWIAANRDRLSRSVPWGRA